MMKERAKRPFHTCIQRFKCYLLGVFLKCSWLLCLTDKITIWKSSHTFLLVLFFSGVQILLFGIVGEYLGRIFNETKNRPLYLVNEYNDKKETNDI